MERLQIDPGHIETGLRAVKAVAMADGTLDERERKLLGAAARALAPSLASIDIEALEAITPDEVARYIGDELTRTRIIQAQLIMAMIDGDVAESEYQVIQGFAGALEVSEPRLHNLRQYMDHHYWLLKMDLNRRSRMTTDAIKKAYRDHGLRGVWRSTLPFMSKLGTDDELAWKYRRLGLLPEHTFGRQYWIHMRERRFAFPGEEHGFPEVFIKHDCCHVLGDYDTDPEGECQVVAFISGFMKTDPFWYLFMVTMHMHLGIETFQNNPLGHLAFDPDKVIAALERGSKVNADLYDVDFDWQPLFELPIDEVRARYNILPR